MNNTDNRSASPQWYRVGMVWLMIALPLASVVVSMVLINIAHENAPKIISTAVE